MRAWFCTVLLLFASCSDVLPAKQCDPARRCSSADVPVCGTDGQWYECGLVADCEEVAVSMNDALCPDPPIGVNGNNLNNPTCAQTCAQAGMPEGGVAGCGMVVVTSVDSSGCVTSCGCDHPIECPAIDFDCAETRPGPDGCPVCVDDCNTPTCDAEGCNLDYPDGEGCPTCSCAPICEPVDVDACNARGCEVVATDADNGCDICSCEEERCDRLFCNNFCEHGYQILDGCPTCECYEPCFELPECDLFCPTGNIIDPATGCHNSCECVSDTCSGVDCALACQWGFRTDGSGCELCECRGAPCLQNEDCAMDETCVPARGAFFDEVPEGECVQLQACDAAFGCDDSRTCGFYFRQDCCPPLTTCTDNLMACPAVCLLRAGDIAHP